MSADAGFLQFCKRSPKACPILDVTAPGDREACRAAPSSDLRTDLPRYRIYRDGTVAGEVSDLRRHWRSDPAAFRRIAWPGPRRSWRARDQMTH